VTYLSVTSVDSCVVFLYRGGQSPSSPVFIGVAAAEETVLRLEAWLVHDGTVSTQHKNTSTVYIHDNVYVN